MSLKCLIAAVMMFITAAIFVASLAKVAGRCSRAEERETEREGKP